jgi:hypothetical protein
MVREILKPAWGAAYLFHLGAFLAGLSYWITSFWREPGLSLAVRLLYRPEGDIQYLPLVSAVSRGIFGESGFLDSFRSGVSAFPLSPLIPYAAAHALFGDWGFVIADGVTGLVMFLIMALFLRTAGASAWVSRCVSLLCVIGLATWLSSQGAKVGVPGVASLSFWGPRYPRPLVTEPIWLLNLTLVLALFHHPEARRSRLFWSILALAFAALVQADIYAASAQGPLLAAIVGWVVLRNRDDRRVWTGLALFVLVTAVALIPFAVQQASIVPDIPRRFGLIPVKRWPLPRQFWEGRPRLLMVTAALLVTGGLAHRVLGLRARGPVWGTLAVLFLAALFSYLALPLSSLLLGKTIQLYHFPEFWQRSSSYVLLATALLAASLVAQQVARRWIAPRWVGTRLVPGATLALGLIWLTIHPPEIRTDHPRHGITTYAALGNGYKRDLGALIDELSSSRYAGRRVLATFDHAVYMWWLTFARKWVAVGDPFLATRPDAELETRFMSFAREMGVDSQRLIPLLDEYMVQLFWFSCAKYQASRAHSFAPIDEYPPAVQTEIRTGSMQNAFNLVIPRSEKERVLRKYETTAGQGTGFAPADVVILTAGDDARGLHPMPSVFSLVYTNPTFRVWLRN